MITLGHHSLALYPILTDLFDVTKQLRLAFNRDRKNKHIAAPRSRGDGN